MKQYVEIQQIDIPLILISLLGATIGLLFSEPYFIMDSETGLIQIALIGSALFGSLMLIMAIVTFALSFDKVKIPVKSTRGKTKCQ